MTAKQRIIFLDNNSTTQIDKRVLDSMMPYLTDEFANASSTHQFGVTAHDAVKTSRKRVASLIGADHHEIIFTSGSTEAINLAIKGVAEGYQSKGKHIITVSSEHSAVLDTCRYLETKGHQVTFLPIAPTGLVELEELKKAITDQTILVSVMLANNETGTIQPVKELASIAHNAGALFMSDATQAVGKIPIDVEDLGVDLLCFSGHKIYGPKGVGALYVRQKGERVKVPALLHGGGHERGFRSGTLNVPGIVGLGTACSLAHSEMASTKKKVEKLRDQLESALLTIPGTSVNGATAQRLFNTSNILFKGVDSDALILGLGNLENSSLLVAVSNGSACTSTSIQPSHVLTAMGLDEVSAFSSIRFSLGKFNTQEEINVAINSIRLQVEKLRLLSS